jgi:hypothetical protein
MRGSGRNEVVSAILVAGTLAACACPARAVHAAAAPAAPILDYWSTVDNPYPKPGPARTVTVFGYFLSDKIPVAGVKMATIWRDGQSRAFCYGITNATGEARCTRRLDNLKLGSSVQISVTLYYEGKIYTTSSSVLPQ